MNEEEDTGKKRNERKKNLWTYFCFVNVKAKLLNLATKLVSYFWCTNDGVCIKVNEEKKCNDIWVWTRKKN